MAQVYVDNGGTGGSGTYADPYGIGELSTAITAATNTGAEDGVVVLKDGSYSTGINAVNPYSSVDVIIKAENALQAITSGLLDQATNSYSITVQGIKFTTQSSAPDIRLAGTNTRLTIQGCHIITTSQLADLKSVGTDVYIRWQDCLIEMSHSLELLSSAGSTANNFTVELYNSTLVFGSGHTGTNYSTGRASTDIQGSIIYKIGSPLAGFFSTTSPDRVINSCAYNTGAVASSAANLITDDPLFVDSSAGDFDLRPDSPCINQVPLIYESPIIPA